MKKLSQLKEECREKYFNDLVEIQELTVLGDRTRLVVSSKTLEELLHRVMAANAVESAMKSYEKAHEFKVEFGDKVQVMCAVCMKGLKVWSTIVFETSMLEQVLNYMDRKKYVDTDLDPYYEEHGLTREVTYDGSPTTWIELE
jgi:hypothetical protein